MHVRVTTLLCSESLEIRNATGSGTRRRGAHGEELVRNHRGVARARRGGAMQVETRVESAWFQPIELKYDNCLQVELSISTCAIMENSVRIVPPDTALIPHRR